MARTVWPRGGNDHDDGGFEVIFLVALIALAVKSASSDRLFDGRRGAPGALAILEERFASGEISQDELQARKRALASLASKKR